MAAVQVSLSSLNRHAVATRADVGTSKAECLRVRLPPAELYLLELVCLVLTGPALCLYSMATEEFACSHAARVRLRAALPPAEAVSRGRLPACINYCESCYESC